MTGESDPLLERIVPSLAKLPGVVAVVLGGSRARGTGKSNSDYDIGLYYGRETALDTSRLLAAVKNLVDDPATAAVTPIGGWGPRIVGGGWLSVAGLKVDLLYRSVEAVRAVIADCRSGTIAMDYQPGHPHGFCSATWLGEVALCRPLHDPRDAIAALKVLSSPYPDKLREALIRTFLWEVSFSIDNGETAIARGDQTHVAGCAYRALCCISQVLFALNRQYLINEKGALAEATSFPHTVTGLSDRADRVWATIGRTQFGTALGELRTLDRDVRALAERA
jgi:hypothetical protein